MVYLLTTVFVGLVVGVFDGFIECLNGIKCSWRGRSKTSQLDDTQWFCALA